jgi:hypothetical protein
MTQAMQRIILVVGLYLGVFKTVGVSLEVSPRK